MQPAYLDFNATTPMDPRVLDAMIPWFRRPSNAGSRTHAFGQEAKAAVDAARSEIANFLGASPEEVVFTSGATESNNLAILGLSQHGENTGRKHILSTTIEHKAVIEPLEEMMRRGFQVEFVHVGQAGYVDPEEIRKRLRKDTLLVSIMHANNETGVLQPIREIAEFLRGSDVVFHTDAAQSFGKEVESLNAAMADLISSSGHKIYGPQGIGALFVRRRMSNPRYVSSILFGGGQERGMRPGTVPVALAVGFGEATRLARVECRSAKECGHRGEAPFA